MSLPQLLFDEVAATLAEAGRPDLVRKLKRYLRKTEDMTSKEAATFLGVSSANTVKNWLKGGHFPGAYATAGGHWRFPRAEVVAVKEQMEALRGKNRDGDVSPPDQEDDQPLPVL